MNIALPAILFILAIMPGFVFLGAFERKENTTIERKPFDESFGFSVFIAFLVHLLLACLFNSLGYLFNSDIAVKLMTGAKINKDEIEILSKSTSKLVGYFLISIISSYLFGKLLQIVLLKIFPYKNSLFSFDTPWYYELKGMVNNNGDSQQSDTISQKQLVKVSCLMDLQAGSYLYYGYLEDFYLQNNGELDRLVLTEASRRRLENDEGAEKKSMFETAKKSVLNRSRAHISRFYDIKGHRITLKYNEVKNLNVEYVYVYIYPDS